MHRMSAIAWATCLLASGCTQEQSVLRSNADYISRMDAVVGIALDKTSSPLHRDLIQQGIVFVDLEDLEVPCVGLRVPMSGSARRIFLSFTKEWFDDNSNEAIAVSLVNDLARVLDDVEHESTSP